MKTTILASKSNEFTNVSSNEQQLKHSIKIITINEVVPLTSIESIMKEYVEYYRHDLSQKIKAGIKKSKERKAALKQEESNL